MIGVKLTLLTFVLTFIFIFIAKIIFESYDELTQLLITSRAYSTYPKSYSIIMTIIGILTLADMIGMVYSAVWLIFFN